MLGIGFVCFFVGELMFGIGLVCFFVGELMFGTAFVCFLWDLCWALGLSVFCGTYVGHWVCLFLCWRTYVGHWVCLYFVGLMLGIGFVCLLVVQTYVWQCVCYLRDLCWALGLSVCWLGDLCLDMVVLFGTSTAD